MNFINQDIERRLLKIKDDFEDVTISERMMENDVIKIGNYVCVLGSRFTIFYEKCGKKYEKSFHLKIPYNTGNYELFKQCKLYAKEIYMYETVFPLIKSLLPMESLQPEFYGTDGKDVLIVEDLFKSGHRVLKAADQLDLEHCKAAFKLLAKFHAVSLKIHETQPHLLDPVCEETLMNSTWLSNEDNCSMHERRFEKVVNRADPCFAAEHAEVIKFFKNNFLRMTLKEIKPDKNCLNVLNHGSFWTNNIIFGYSPQGRVKNAKCIDVQTCRWGSPANDILHFTVTSMKFEIFEQFFDILLEMYVTIFNATLNYLHCKTSLKIDNLRADIESKCGWSLYLVVCSLPYISAGTDLTFKMMHEDWIIDEKHFVELSKLWIRHFIKIGIFARYEEAALAISVFSLKFETENGVKISNYELEDIMKLPVEYCMADIKRIKYEYKMGEKIIRDSVLLKIPSINLNYNNKLNENETRIYGHEIYMFEKVLSEMYKLWKGEPFSPMYYTSTGSKVLILEDVFMQGFCLPDKNAQLDLHHSFFALKTLAKYHALGAKYLQNLDQPLVESLIQPFKMSYSKESIWNSAYESFLENVESLVSKSIFDKLNKFRDKIPESMIYSRHWDENSLSVLRQGDCSILNILFKYDENGRVDAARLIDWKSSRKASPAVDLIEFFVTSVRFDIFVKHEKELFDVYLDSLNKTFALLDFNYAYSHSELEKDLKKFNYSFLFFISALPFTLSKKNADFKRNNSDRFPPNILLVMIKWLNYLEKTNMI